MCIRDSANRSWCSVATVPGYTKTATIVDVKDATLYMQFLTPKASDMLESRNVVPFLPNAYFQDCKFWYNRWKTNKCY